MHDSTKGLALCSASQSPVARNSFIVSLTRSQPLDGSSSAAQFGPDPLTLAIAGAGEFDQSFQPADHAATFAGFPRPDSRNFSPPSIYAIFLSGGGFTLHGLQGRRGKTRTLNPTCRPCHFCFHEQHKLRLYHLCHEPSRSATAETVELTSSRMAWATTQTSLDARGMSTPNPAKHLNESLTLFYCNIQHVVVCINPQFHRHPSGTPNHTASRFIRSTS